MFVCPQPAGPVMSMQGGPARLWMGSGPLTDTPLAWDVEVRRRTFIRHTPLGPDWTAVTDRFRSPPDLPTVGPAGADYSLDGGVTWRAAARVTYSAVAFVSPSAGWAVGPGGRITRFAFVDE